ncbi:hypothetical protein HDV63DRAFT_154727 [Trichoderma sp. SZMC 28014]
MPLGASRIKQKAHPLGGQLHAWLAAAASPRLRDGFREPILQIAGSSQAEADAWDPRFPIPCGFFVFLSAYFRFAFPDGAPLSLWLISAVKPQNPEGWTRRPRLETTALATSTARISSCAHKTQRFRDASSFRRFYQRISITGHRKVHVHVCKREARAAAVQTQPAGLESKPVMLPRNSQRRRLASAKSTGRAPVASSNPA